MKVFTLLIITTLFNSLFALELLIGMPYKGAPLGHTAVVVQPKGMEPILFSFGRYGSTFDAPLQGEGILLVFRGRENINHYLYRHRQKRDTAGYQIILSDYEEMNVYNHFQTLIKHALWKKQHKHFERYRLSRDYNGVTVQCSSIALEGLKKVLGDEYYDIFNPKFNKGQGLSVEEKSYYFATQKKLSIDDVNTPLDLIDALTNAERTGHPRFGKKRLFFRHQFTAQQDGEPRKESSQEPRS